jgi:hypothetical protein
VVPPKKHPLQVRSWSGTHSSFRKNTNYPVKQKKRRHSTVVVRVVRVYVCALRSSYFYKFTREEIWSFWTIKLNAMSKRFVRVCACLKASAIQSINQSFNDMRTVVMDQQRLNAMNRNPEQSETSVGLSGWSRQNKLTGPCVGVR